MSKHLAVRPAGTNQHTMVSNNVTDHEPVKRGNSLGTPSIGSSASSRSSTPG